MKKLFLFFILLPWCALLAAQDCYNYTRTKGISLYDQGRYADAKNNFAAAKDCPDKPASNDLDFWLEKCDAAIVAGDSKKTETSTKKTTSGQSNVNLNLNIRSMEFANTTNSGEIINDFGTPLAASQIKYLKPRFTYDGLSASASVTLYVKLIKPDGTLSYSSSSPSGYTYSKNVSLTPGSGNTCLLTGWGTDSGGSYIPGTWRIEVWMSGKRIFQKDFVLQDKLAASYLRVDNQTEVSSVYVNSGGTRTYSVSTDGTSYEVALLPSWCSVTEKTASSFTIRYSANTSAEVRSDWFQVKSGEKKVKVSVSQAASSYSGSSRGSSSYGGSNNRMNTARKKISSHPVGFEFGYVQKSWKYSDDGTSVKTGFWGQGEKAVHGLQTGIGIDPHIWWLLYAHTGVYYEYYYSKSKDEYLEGYDVYGKFEEHSLYVPAQIELKIPVSDKIYIFLNGGFGFDFGLAASVKSCLSGESEPYHTEKWIYGNEDMEYMRRFNLSGEFGGGLSLWQWKIGCTAHRGLLNRSLVEGYNVKQNKLSFYVAYMF